jgi:hypothetical protein
MVLIATNAQNAPCSGKNIPYLAACIDDSMDDFSVAATMKQSNVTIKVRANVWIIS